MNKGCLALLLCSLVVGCTSVKDQAVLYDIYKVDVVDSFNIQKAQPADWFQNLTIYGDNFSYYSRYDKLCIGKLSKDSIIQPKVICVSPSRRKAVNCAQTFINDSLLFIAFDRFITYMDSTMFIYNHYTGERIYDFDLSNLNFITKSEVSMDSFRSTHGLVDWANRLLALSNPILSSDKDRLFIPLMAGTKDRSYLRTDKPNVLSINLLDGSADVLNTRFSDVSTKFNDSINTQCCRSCYFYFPEISELDGSSYLISYALLADMTRNDFTSNKTELIKGFPAFLDESEKYFANFETKATDQLYLFRQPITTKNSSLILRLVQLPDLPVSDRELCLVYSKEPRISPVGVIPNLAKKYRVLTMDDSGFVYACKKKDMSSSRGNLTLFKIKISISGSRTGKYIYKPSSEYKSNDFEGYLSKNFPSLQNLDTIPLIFAQDACGTCITKCGKFLSKAQTANLTTRPVILISSNPVKAEEYMDDFNIASSDNILIDSTSQLLKYIKHPQSIACLIKINGAYEVKKYGVNEMQDLLHYINPSIRLEIGVCKPSKNY